jgi:hypothetical protein
VAYINFGGTGWMSDTDLRSLFWRDGSTKAEHLAAATLRLSGYEEIDPAIGNEQIPAE